MKKVTEIFYLDNVNERASEYSKGILLILEDGSRVELMTTDVVADKYTNPRKLQGIAGDSESLE